MEPSDTVVGEYHHLSQLGAGDVFVFFSDPRQERYLILRVQRVVEKERVVNHLIYFALYNRCSKELTKEQLPTILRLLCCSRMSASTSMLVIHHDSDLKKIFSSLF